jgi:hypothetical protein
MYVQGTYICNLFVAFASKVDCSQQSENTLFSIDVGKILCMYIAFSNAYTQTPQNQARYILQLCTIQLKSVFFELMYFDLKEGQTNYIFTPKRKAGIELHITVGF